MKKSIYLLALLSSSLYAASVPTDGIITSDTTMTGTQTITECELSVAKSTTLTIEGDLTVENNEKSYTIGGNSKTSTLNNLGTIDISSNGTLSLISGTISGTTSASTSNAGTITVDGKLYSSLNNGSDLHLYRVSSAVSITLNSTGLISLTGGQGLGVSNYQTSIKLEASVTKDGNDQWATGLITNKFYAARGAASESFRILVNAADAFCKQDGTATDIFIAKNGSIGFTFKSGMTDFGNIAFRDNTKLYLDLTADADGFSIKSLTSDVASATAYMKLTNFQNDFLWLESFQDSSITDGGVLSYTANNKTLTLNITALNGETSSADGKWYFTEAGFLNNTAFPISSVPEPSFYAAILGAIALTFAINRRRR